MNIKQHIPNMITCGNLFCGCLAIVFAFKGDLVWSAYLVGIAAVLDFFDGFVARLLKVGGELGKQLDSLADMVTFGLVPGVVMYHLLLNSWLIKDDLGIVQKTDELICLVGFLITIFSAMRLAKFNIDTRQTDSFIGVPTPANSMLICSLPLILDQVAPKGGYSLYPPISAVENAVVAPDVNAYLFWVNIIQNPYFLIGLTIVMSYMLVAELPLFALKFKNFGWPDNKIRYGFLIISLVLLIVFQFVAIPFIIFLYILLSIINNVAAKRKIQNT